MFSTPLREIQVGYVGQLLHEPDLDVDDLREYCSDKDHRDENVRSALSTAQCLYGTSRSEETGVPLFRKGGSAGGMREDGTGEHVVVVRPEFDGPAANPRADIEAWARDGASRWRPVAQLQASYEERQR